MKKTVAMFKTENKVASKLRTWKKIKSMRLLYLMLLLPAVLLILWGYSPIYGFLMAFKNYRYRDGILGSEWNNFEHFRFMFNDPLFLRALLNTIRLSLKNILITFSLPIIFALMLNEIVNSKFKKVVQTISYMPHFLSWVVMGQVVYQVLSPSIGVVNSTITAFGGETVFFQGIPEYFDAIYLTFGSWKGIGWGSIIYLAAITGVNPELYESAQLDGANRFQKAIYIILPAITPVIVIQLILSFQGIMSAGFDAVFNLYNPMVMSRADVIDTFAYRAGLQEGRYDYGTAIGLFQNLISMVMVVVVNSIARKISDYALW